MKKKQQDVEDWRVNNIVNITIVDDFLNKREIRDKPPSKYMKKFAANNDEIVNTMKTHLIGNLEDFGISNDDFENFLNERAKLISKEIKKRLIRSPSDNSEGLTYYEE